MKPLTVLRQEAHEAVRENRILWHKDYDNNDWPAICFATLTARGFDATGLTDQYMLRLESTLDLPGLQVQERPADGN